MNAAISILAERNREAMRLFEKCINTNDIELGRKQPASRASCKVSALCLPHVAWQTISKR